MGYFKRKLGFECFCLNNAHVNAETLPVIKSKLLELHNPPPDLISSLIYQKTLLTVLISLAMPLRKRPRLKSISIFIATGVFELFFARLSPGCGACLLDVAESEWCTRLACTV
jgi:hypothetical protein